MGQIRIKNKTMKKEVLMMNHSNYYITSFLNEKIKSNVYDSFVKGMNQKICHLDDIKIF